MSSADEVSSRSVLEGESRTVRLSPVARSSGQGPARGLTQPADVSSQVLADLDRIASKLEGLETYVMVGLGARLSDDLQERIASAFAAERKGAARWLRWLTFGLAALVIAQFTVLIAEMQGNVVSRLTGSAPAPTLARQAIVPPVPLGDGARLAPRSSSDAGPPTVAPAQSAERVATVAPSDLRPTRNVPAAPLAEPLADLPAPARPLESEGLATSPDTPETRQTMRRAAITPQATLTTDIASVTPDASTARATDPEASDIAAPADTTTAGPFTVSTTADRTATFASGAELAPKSLDLEGAARVQYVQERLTALGYDIGAVDGLMGGRTQTAIAAFREERGLPDGQALDEDLLRALEAARRDG